MELRNNDPEDRSATPHSSVRGGTADLRSKRSPLTQERTEANLRTTDVFEFVLGEQRSDDVGCGMIYRSLCLP
jgi:hypothetical protein